MKMKKHKWIKVENSHHPKSLCMLGIFLGQRRCQVCGNIDLPIISGLVNCMG